MCLSLNKRNSSRMEKYAREVIVITILLHSAHWCCEGMMVNICARVFIFIIQKELRLRGARKKDRKCKIVSVSLSLSLSLSAALPPIMKPTSRALAILPLQRHTHTRVSWTGIVSFVYCYSSEFEQAFAYTQLRLRVNIALKLQHGWLTACCVD